MKRLFLLLLLVCGTYQITTGADMVFVQIDGVQLRTQKLPPSDSRTTVIGFDMSKRKKVYFEIPSNQTFTAVASSTDSSHLYALKKEISKYEKTETEQRTYYNFLDVGEFIVERNQNGIAGLRWKSLLSKEQLKRMEAAEISILNMKAWMNTLLLEFHAPVSKHGYTTNYESRSVTYDIESGTFTPTIATILEQVESVMEKNKGLEIK